jgi:hypothetical protein
MDAAQLLATGEDPEPLLIELRILHEAAWMVATGAARRVVLAGLRFANELLGAAGESALEPGVVRVALWRPDETGVDIAIEPTHPDARRPDPWLPRSLREAPR